MASSQVNYSSCCRLCLTVESSPFDDARDDRSLLRNIATSLAVEISRDDKLSTMVCQPCVTKVTNWHSFKSACTENQSKLQDWYNSTAAASTAANDIANMSLQIKEEPLDDTTDSSPVILVNGETPVIKNEISDASMDEEYNDLPPPLTPQRIENGDLEVINPAAAASTADNSATKPKKPNTNPKKCNYCKKILSSRANRIRHEKAIHEVQTPSESETGSLSQDDQSQSSVDSQPITEASAEERKILFAAGLKLLQRDSTPISQEPLSKIELSYTEKCKAMVKMHETLTCACHNAYHPNLKGLLSHLRSSRIWFPAFTCYHCMITFTDRSASTKHFCRCPNSGFATLIKLSNLKKRSEVKTRLYQLYRCKKCRFMYSFHEDFCKHVDEDHSHVRLPYTCSCGRNFTTLEDYKDHAYVSCLVEYYCDICFITTNSLSAFQAHAVEKHDQSEGFSLLQDDNYRRRSAIIEPSTRKTVATRPKPTLKREYTDEKNIITGKRRSSYKPPVIEPEFDDEEEEKVAKKVAKTAIVHPQIPGTVCPICNREYASNNNMWRHYKTHVQDPLRKDAGEDSVYCCPDCGGMFNASEWEKHRASHQKKQCTECGKVFQFQSELDRHRSVHLNLKVYRDSKTQSYKSAMVSPDIIVLCEICDRTFKSKEELKVHKTTHHNDDMPVLEQSVGLAQNAPRHACNVCNKRYMGYSGLWDHKRKKHPELYAEKEKEKVSFPKQCEYCPKVFTKGGAYTCHKQMHERNNALLSQSSSNRSTPNTAESNEDESYHTCKKCFKVFSTRSNLKNHMRSHGINLASPTSKTTKHKTVKKVWCDICHCAFDSMALLEQHREDEHDSAMPDLQLSDEDKPKAQPYVFTCDICTQTFMSHSGLKKHKAKHAKELPIVVKNRNMVHCKYCKVTFETAQQLAYHMKEEHLEGPNGKKAAAQAKTSAGICCKLCKKQFKTQSALHAHMGWHSREGRVKEKMELAANGVEVKDEPKELPFKCNKCGAAYHTDTALQIHILEKHRNVNAFVLAARCTVCNIDFSTQEEYDQHKQHYHAKKAQPGGTKQAQLPRPGSTKQVSGSTKGFREMHAEPEFKCSQCSRVFDRETSLNIHLKVHAKHVKTAPAQAKTTMYSCSICSQSFALPKDLRTHTIQAHPF